MFENFAISRTALTVSGFSVYAVVEGYTSIRILKLFYLAINRNFPYHVNAFSDIAANFSNGNLLNISTSSTGTRVYKNTINYGVLAGTIGSVHNRFGTDLTKNKILLFLNSLYFNGVLYSTAAARYSL